jgi:hypothetical protein
MMTGGFENSGVKIFSPGRGVRHVGDGDRNDLFDLRRERPIGKNSLETRMHAVRRTSVVRVTPRNWWPRH